MGLIIVTILLSGRATHVETPGGDYHHLRPFRAIFQLLTVAHSSAQCIGRLPLQCRYLCFIPAMDVLEWRAMSA